MVAWAFGAWRTMVSSVTAASMPTVLPHMPYLSPDQLSSGCERLPNGYLGDSITIYSLLSCDLLTSFSITPPLTYRLTSLLYQSAIRKLLHSAEIRLECDSAKRGGVDGLALEAAERKEPAFTKSLARSNSTRNLPCTRLRASLTFWEFGHPFS